MILFLLSVSYLLGHSTKRVPSYTSEKNYFNNEYDSSFYFLTVDIFYT